MTFQNPYCLYISHVCNALSHISVNMQLVSNIQLSNLTSYSILVIPSPPLPLQHLCTLSALTQKQCVHHRDSQVNNPARLKQAGEHDVDPPPGEDALGGGGEDEIFISFSDSSAKVWYLAGKWPIFIRQHMRGNSRKCEWRIGHFDNFRYQFTDLYQFPLM